MHDDDIPTKTLKFSTGKRRVRDAGIEFRRRIPLRVLQEAILSQREKDLLVYTILATYQDMRGPWFRLRKDVQRSLTLPARTRTRYLARLERSGFIELRRSPGACYEVRVAPWSNWLRPST